MIVYCCADLIFATKIRGTAEALGLTTRPVRNKEMLDARLKQVDDGKPNEPVSALFLDLDTGEDGLTLLDHVKAQNPSIPVLAFGSHVATELLQAARQRGADTVMSRGGFTANLPDLLRRYSGAA